MFFPHQISIQYPLCQYQASLSYFGLNYLNSLRENMAIPLKIAEYEKQYQNNFTMLKAKYRKKIFAYLSLKELCLNFLTRDQDLKENNEVQKKKNYCFLCFLSFFEVHCQKPHEFFVFF